MIYGERHKPVDEGSKVWLKLRPRRPHTAGIDWSAQGKKFRLGSQKLIRCVTTQREGRFSFSVRSEPVEEAQRGAFWRIRYDLIRSESCHYLSLSIADYRFGL